MSLKSNVYNMKELWKYINKYFLHLIHIVDTPEMDSHTHYPYIYYFALIFAYCWFLVREETRKTRRKTLVAWERTTLETNSVHVWPRLIQGYWHSHDVIKIRIYTELCIILNKSSPLSHSISRFTYPFALVFPFPGSMKGLRPNWNISMIELVWAASVFLRKQL